MLQKEKTEEKNSIHFAQDEGTVLRALSFAWVDLMRV